MLYKWSMTDLAFFFRLKEAKKQFGFLGKVDKATCGFPQSVSKWNKDEKMPKIFVAVAEEVENCVVIVTV